MSETSDADDRIYIDITHKPIDVAFVLSKGVQ